MQTLFPIESLYPPGFLYKEDFVTEEEELQLENVIAGIQLHPFHFQGYEAKRKVASFGCDWNFERQELTRGKQIPSAFEWLVRRVASHLFLKPAEISELLVTEYPAGAIINWHRDAPPFEVVAGISLLADCVFKLRPLEKEKQTRKATLSLPVRRRSLYVMQQAVRWNWQHSMAPVEQRRVSITLRTLKPEYNLPD